MNRKSKSLTLYLTLAVTAALMMSGCGNKSESPATQAAAKVNDAEITVHQVNQLLKGAESSDPAEINQLRKKMLDSLIDQELMAAKAVEEKLDRTPETMMALESAKRAVLARTYMDKFLADGPKLESGDITRYYYDHPELFAEHKIYNLLEIVFQANESDRKEVLALAHANVPTEEIYAMMKRKGITYRSTPVTRAASQLPVGMVKYLHKANNGDAIFISKPQSQILIRLISSRTQPVDEATAIPVIRRFLGEQHLKDLTDKKVKTLRETAKIQYVGEFAELSKEVAKPDPNAMHQDYPAQSVTPLPPASADTAQAPATK